MSKKHRYFLIHKPFKVLSQFSDEGVNKGLGSIYDVQKDVYPVGRLDLDSEGLLILTNDKQLNNKLLNPKFQHQRTYWAQVEGIPKEDELQKFRKGLSINLKGKIYSTLPAEVQIVKPVIEERNPPVNHAKHPDKCWLQIKLIEGKNRQVRKMTASIGHPTLRLIRIGIEEVFLHPLKSGEITEISGNVLYKKLKLL